MLAQLRKARQSESGFTLIELLMVIVILGVLAGVVVFAVGGITDKGQTSACKADYKTMQVAEEAYYAQNGSYAAEPLLVSAKLLNAPSALVDVGAASGTSYSLTAVTPCTAAMVP